MKRYDNTSVDRHDFFADRRSGLGNNTYLVGQTYSGNIQRTTPSSQSARDIRVGIFAQDVHRTPRTRKYAVPSRAKINGADNLDKAYPSYNHQAFYRGKRFKD